MVAIWDTFSAGTIVAIAMTGLASGTLIGIMGVGGVIIVPIMLELVEISTLGVQTIVVGTMAAYIAPALVATTWYAVKKDVDWRVASWMIIFATPGAALGAYLLSVIEARWVEFTVYLMLLGSSSLGITRATKAYCAEKPCEAGVGACMKRECSGLCRSSSQHAQPKAEMQEAADADRANADDTPEQEPQNADPSENVLKTEVEAPARIKQVAAGIIGLTTGVLSTLTGTSGPASAMPQMLILDWDIRLMLGCAQTVQVPIAIAATIAYQIVAEVPLYLVYSLTLGCMLGVGCLVGIILSKRINTHLLKLICVAILLGLGVWFMTRWIVQNTA